MKTKNLRLIGILLLPGILLLIAYFAMSLTGGVKWSRFDFVLAGAVILGTGMLCELVLRFVKSTAYRLAIFAGILIALSIVWVELAVGLFNTRFAGS